MYIIVYVYIKKVINFFGLYICLMYATFYMLIWSHDFNLFRKIFKKFQLYKLIPIDNKVDFPV